MKKVMLAFAMAVAVTGCDQASTNVNEDGSGQQLDVAGAIAKMESEGSAPKLDRSDSLRGEDADDNGIRDDIEIFIDGATVQDAEKIALRSYATGMQRIQTAEEMTPEVASAITDTFIPSYFCMTTFSDNQEEIRRIAKEVSAFTANTPDRAQRYLEYNAAMDGSAINIPSPAQCQEVSQ